MYKTHSQVLAAPSRRNPGGTGSKAQLYFLVETQEGVAQRSGTTWVSVLRFCEAKRKPSDQAKSGVLAQDPWPRVFLLNLAEGTGRPRKPATSLQQHSLPPPYPSADGAERARLCTPCKPHTPPPEIIDMRTSFILNTNEPREVSWRPLLSVVTLEKPCIQPRKLPVRKRIIVMAGLI